MSFNVAIDGPAGAGKSTIARAVAKKKGFGFSLFRKKKDRLDDELEKEEQLLAEEGVGLNGKKYDD